MKLVLFDIDGTLLLTGGAGSRALRRALYRVFGLANGMNSIRPDGKTDPQIVQEALRRHGKEQGVIVPSFFRTYLEFLEGEIRVSPNFVVLPGVRRLVSRLDHDKRFSVGLATGNIEEGARLKLKRAGLSSFFSFGAFGSDAEDRTRLIRIAIHRGLEKISPADLEAVFVIGDTPRDIIHGREAKAKTIAVATGSYSLDTLRSYGPDLALPSLEMIEPIEIFMAECS